MLVSPSLQPCVANRLSFSPTATEDERNEWSSEIRQAKAQLLVSFNITHPNSTLTSSSSTKHLRLSLQALPYPPSDERLLTVDRKNPKGKWKKGAELKERRGRVEHWVPAIWVPDEKTEGCMRCGRTFGWRRRRHHCRLCGKCVCAACSGKVSLLLRVPSLQAIFSFVICNFRRSSLLSYLYMLTCHGSDINWLLPRLSSSQIPTQKTTQVNQHVHAMHATTLYSHSSRHPQNIQKHSIQTKPRTPSTPSATSRPGSLYHLFLSARRLKRLWQLTASPPGGRGNCTGWTTRRFIWTTQIQGFGRCENV